MRLQVRLVARDKIEGLGRQRQTGDLARDGHDARRRQAAVFRRRRNLRRTGSPGDDKAIFTHRSHFRCIAFPGHPWIGGIGRGHRRVQLVKIPPLERQGHRLQFNALDGCIHLHLATVGETAVNRRRDDRRQTGIDGMDDATRHRSDRWIGAFPVHVGIRRISGFDAGHEILHITDLHGQGFRTEGDARDRNRFLRTGKEAQRQAGRSYDLIDFHVFHGLVLDTTHRVAFNTCLPITLGEVRQC